MADMDKAFSLGPHNVWSAEARAGLEGKTGTGELRVSGPILGPPIVGWVRPSVSLLAGYNDKDGFDTRPVALNVDVGTPLLAAFIYPATRVAPLLGGSVGVNLEGKVRGSAGVDFVLGSKDQALDTDRPLHSIGVGWQTDVLNGERSNGAYLSYKLTFAKF